MSDIKALKYSKGHEWVRVEGNRAYTGITEFAQKSLGDIVFVELPSEGDEFKAEDVLGVVESVKAASDIYCPLSGKVVEVNTSLEDEPAKINSAPYDSWIAVLEMSNMAELDHLMSLEQYEEFCRGENN